MSYGITAQGFIIKEESTILSEMVAQGQGLFGTTQDLTYADPIGQTIAIAARALAQTWQALEDCYNSFYVDQAEGISLDRAVALRGLVRQAAQSADVTLTYSGTNGTSVAVGAVTSQTPGGIQFTNIQSGIISSGVLSLLNKSVLTGLSNIVPPNTINQLSSPVSGISSVVNSLASANASDLETDPELRLRFKALSSSGGSSVPAIISALKAVTGISHAHVYENYGDLNDAYNRPPHSIECVVYGTQTDLDVANAIFNSKPAGIEMMSTGSSGVIKSLLLSDDNGDPHTMYWTQAAQVMINVKVAVTSNSAWNAAYLTTIKTRIVQAIGGVDTIGSVATDYSATGLDIGENVLSWNIETNFDDIPGIDDISVTLARYPATPTSARKVIISYYEFARADSANISITVT
jgi:hypothetical protein